MPDANFNGNDNEDLVVEKNRLFTRYMKEQCWKKADTVPGRDPDRWRRDPAGNVVAYKLRGCDGCLCHEYDHIIPFSRGGRTVLENCQILQTRPNRFKGNEDNDPVKLRAYSCAKEFKEEDLDMVEMALYGGVKREGLECRCKSKFEVIKGFKEAAGIVGLERRNKPILPDCPK